MSAREVDLVVIGAGPAGLAAATQAAQAGLSVVLLDEQPAPGGQIYRGIENAGPERLRILGPDYASGRGLAEAFRVSGAEYRPGATVWNIGTDRLVEFSQNGRSEGIRGKAVLAATGAVERPMPVPGWTLPGVSTAGALQILLKSGGVLEEDAVLVGAGPLLWLLAAQMVDAGCPPKAVVENLPKGRLRAAARHVAGALHGRRYLLKGLAMMRRVRAAGVPVHSGATDIKIEGQDRAEAVSFISAGRAQRIVASCVALHQGVVPNQQITRLLRVDHLWDRTQHCFRPVLDEAGRTSLPWLFVAGDGGGIMGAKSAALQGRLAGIAIAADAGRPMAAPERGKMRQALARDAAIRPLLEALYAPAPEVLRPADTTILCRCEEVTAGQIRQTVRHGAPGPNQIKSMLRAGMGPCQGRVCGLAVSGVIASEKGEEPEVTGYYRIRPPLKPIPLMELAGYAPDLEPAP